MNKSLIIILVFFIFSCKETKLPPSGICISFDDRSVDEWFAIKNLLNEYDAKVSFFITQFDSLTASEIVKLKQLESDGHEIGSHGALHVVSEFYIKNNTYKDYLENEINPSIRSMKQAGFNIKSFAYPYGAKYWFTDFMLLQKFDVLRSVTSINKEKDLTLIDEIYYDFNGDRTLSAIGIDTNGKVTKEMIKNAIKRASDNNQVLMVYGHIPMSSPASNSYELDIDFLKFILVEAKRKGLEFYRFKDLTAK
ncbi:polysaccharide deacetylase family protein [Adhaeribacter aquaticus]|uniref:polysaccharide deacetylase family protein n=1 Tax=Adhaeribacter aquaticus TaxID=299567 RepID=UPI000422F6CD|nr:polysaccharide deacetylase family protein [Adhaeribacter aquaticus]